ncbi:MAG: alpha/beta hydrolase fold domain-containing protein, partial [Candidatus Marinimicrobia bacterium]|nr:alpha/beta hydrolase fold domain-containing protein [Candidatus Neomarinimicrobiota bacterium]
MKNKILPILLSLFLLTVILQAQTVVEPDSEKIIDKDTYEKSWVAQAIEKTMWDSKIKEGNSLLEFMNYLNKTTPARPLNSMYLKYLIEVNDSLGHKVWTLEPVVDKSDEVIIYLHGGSYMYNFVSGHWLFISYIIDQLKAKVIAPDYPLAPKYNVSHVFDMLLELYTGLIKEVDPKKISIIGDSAGGGMSLALGQLLQEKGLPQPKQLIMLSPCVDVTLSNPDIMKFEKKDPLLNIESILKAGHLYAGPLDRTHYLVSPIYGKLTGLAPISCYVGTHDLL